MARITHIVVHYTATYPDQNIRAATIDTWHRERGFKSIGYHWFVGRDGLVEPGRPERETGAHVGGQNTGKIGIAWAGGLERSTGPNAGVKNMTPAQETALIGKIRDVLSRYPGAKVVGHRDLAATQCPGFDVPAWWAAANRAAPAPSAPSSPPPDPAPTGLSAILTFLAAAAALGAAFLFGR